jgi:titin
MTGILSGIIGSMKGATAPKTAPTSLSAIPTNTNVAISFTIPSDDGGSEITNYEYSFNNSTWTALSPVDITSPITVSGLTQNTAYTIYLRAVNIVGSGPASTGLSLTTQGVPTSAPSSLSATRTNTTVAISFTAAASSTSLTNYQYSFNNSSWTALSPADAVSPVTVSGLSQNTAYTVYLRGVNSYGSGPGSTGVSFTTLGPPTGTPTITSVPVGTTTATVNFTYPGGGGAVTGYDVYVANKTNAWNNAGVTTSPISITGLTANTTYTFYVRAKNAYGVGPQSAGVNKTTNPVFMSATGGTTFDYVSGGQTFRSHAFTGSGTFTVSTVGSFGVVDLLIVGGGGKGGNSYSGYGGGGGTRQISSIGVSATAYGVTVGGGATSTGGRGGDTSALGYTAYGGGSATAVSGGSGGGHTGGAPANKSVGGAGNIGGFSPAEGYAGGGSYGPDNNGVTYGGTGGGSAGAGSSWAGGAPGWGGGGKSSTLETNTATNYGGGGGWFGGAGGGGNSAAPAGTAGLGGGGADNGNGGSGRVVIRYRIA